MFKNTGGERVDFIYSSSCELADADMELTTEIIGRLLDEPGAEDPEAGYDGVPFTQTENEDEFLDWIDWDNLAA